MRSPVLFAVLLAVSSVTSQSENNKAVPSITTVSLDEGTVTVLHLRAGYVTSVKLPDEISSVVIGNPASFKAEHSEVEPRLVFLKPITGQAVETNALITTKSGQEISLHLISTGDLQGDSAVDFLLEYRRAPRIVDSNNDRPGFLIPEMDSRFQSPPVARAVRPEKLDFLTTALEQQVRWSAPDWKGK